MTVICKLNADPTYLFMCADDPRIIIRIRTVESCSTPPARSVKVSGPPSPVARRKICGSSIDRVTIEGDSFDDPCYTCTLQKGQQQKNLVTTEMVRCTSL